MPYVAVRRVLSCYKGAHIWWEPGQEVLGAETWPTLQIFLNNNIIRFVERVAKEECKEDKKEECKEIAEEAPKKRGRKPKAPVDTSSLVKEIVDMDIKTEVII